MAAKSLSTWLGAFVTSEAEALIRWRQATLSRPVVKHEAIDGVYYSNDYSNLRIHHASTPPEAGKLQIQKILNIGDIVTAFVSDGHTRIKARFFERAVATLEAEIGEKLDASMQGDVVTLTQFNIAVTHMGPTDSFVQLEVEQIKYDFHLRKTIGEPTPIEETADIRRIIQQVERFWAKENPTYIESDDDDDDNDDDDHHPNAEKGLPASQEAMPDSQAVPAPQHLARNQASPRAPEASLKTSPRGFGMGRRGGGLALGGLHRDDYDARNDANLELPRQASGRPVSSRPLRPSPEHKRLRLEKTNHLLGLLGQGSRPLAPKLPKPLQAPSMEVSSAQTPVKQPSAALVQESNSEQSTQVNFQSALPMTQQQHTLPKKTSTRDLSVSGTTSGTRTQNDGGKNPSHDAEAAASAIDSMRHPPSEPTSMGAQIAQSNPASSSANSGRIPYGRRKIPKDQMKLLEHPSSWYHPQPGHQFPVPNLPVDLLKQFAEAHMKSMEPSQQATPEQGRHTMQSSRPGTPDTTMLPSSSSDEEISASQWPPTPSQRRADLPPDSSFPGIAGGGQDADDLEVSVPRALTIERPVTGAAKQTMNYPAAASQHSAGNKPSLTTQILNSSPPLLRAQQDFRPRTASSTRSSNYQASPSRSARTASSPIQDPAITHRDRRRNWFNFVAQRREWLLQNYEPDDNAAIHPNTLVVLYRLAFENDPSATVDDFLSIIRQAFPRLTNVTEESSTWPLSPCRSTPSPSSMQDGPPARPPGATENPPHVTALTAAEIFHLEDPTPPSRQPMASSSSSLPTGQTSRPRTQPPNSALPILSSPLKVAGNTLQVTHPPPPAIPPHPPLGMHPEQQPGVTRANDDDDAVMVDDREESADRDPPAEALGKARARTERAAQNAGQATDAWPEPVPIFRQFYEDWCAIRPGGAFAAPQPPGAAPARRPRRRIDLLRWDI